MDPQNNYGKVAITYTYNSISYTVYGSFTTIDPYNFIAIINDDTNFPTTSLTSGILVQIDLDKTTNEISSVTLNFNIKYLYPSSLSSLSSAPISNVTIDGNVILNGTSIPVKYNNMIFQTIEQAYILYTFIPSPVPVTVPVSITDCFSPGATNQVATTKTQTTAFLTAIDSGNVLTKDQRTQIVDQLGLIAGHGFSIGECLQKISDALTKNF
jgi:hypothetical protein